MNRRVRVVLLVDTVGGGGAEQVVADLAVNLDSQRFDVAVCATRADGRQAAEVRRSGVPVTVIGRRSRWDVPGMLRLWSFLRDGGFDVLHAHKFGSNVWARLFGRSSGIPVVIIHEHSWDYRGGFKRDVRAGLDRFLSRFCDAVVTPSEADRQAWERVVGVAPRKLRLVRNGVAKPAPQPASLRRELGLSEDAIVIGNVGRLEPEKGFDLLVRAFALVANRYPQARLILVGDGSQRAALEALSHDLGVADRCLLTGYRHAASGLMGEFDIFASASRNEGLPLALIEAMSAGRPVVATAVGGVPEVVVDGATGFLVPGGDIALFGEQLGRLIDDADLRNRMGQNGQARYQALFTVERMVSEIEAIYMDLLRTVTSEVDVARQDRQHGPAVSAQAGRKASRLTSEAHWRE
jgi:glycosyltransferase involved in cell wall biosynthesis